MKLSFRTKISLTLFAALFTGMGLISIFVIHRLNQTQHQTTAQDFEKIKKIYNNEINLHALMLAAEVRAASLMPRLKAVFWAVEDRQIDFAVLTRIYGRAQVDLLLLTDHQGKLLFDASDITSRGDDLTNFPGIQTSFNPSDFTGIWQYKGHFYNVAISAVWQNRFVVGQVVIGKHLGKIGDALSVVTEKNVYLLHQNKLISHATVIPESLPPQQNEIMDIAGKIAQNNISDQTYTPPFQVTLGGQSGLALALPFPTPQTYAIFFLTTSRSETELLNTRNWILLVFGIGIIPIALICWWLSGQIIRPILQLGQAAKQLENGEQETSVPTHTQDELGELSKSLTKLAKTIQSNAHLQREIQEHQQTEWALRDSEATMRVLLDAIPDLMFRIRRDGTFLSAHAHPEDLQIPQDQFIGRKISDVLPEHISTLALKKIDLTFETKQNQSFEYMLTINDRDRYYEGRTAICSPNEVLVIARDISERKFAENAQQEAEKRLEAQQAQSLRADRLRSLGEMAAGIAHELNQPLVGVRGMAEHILIATQRDWDQPKELLQERVTDIIEQADRMVNIIQHVRLFAREAGKPDLKPIQVNDVVTSSLNLLSVQFRSHGIELDATLSENLPLVSGNPFSLEEVILNLLNNARDAVEENQAGSDCINIRTGISGSSVLIDVEDNGIGIPMEILNRVFDPFYTTKEPDKGTGLGLSVSRSIIEEHGGSLDIRSRPGQGTVVTITLPALQDAKVESQNEAATS